MTRRRVVRVLAAMAAATLAVTGAATIGRIAPRAAADPAGPTEAWTTQTLPGPVGLRSLPTPVRFAPDGTRFVAIRHDDDDMTVTVTSPGSTTGQVTDLGTTNATSQNEWVPNPGVGLAVGPTGAAAVVWTDAAGVPHLRTRPVGATEWSTTTDFPSTNDDRPTVAVSRAGGLTVAWIHYYNNTSTVEVVTGSGPTDPALQRVLPIGPTGYDFIRHLQVGYSGGRPQLVWALGGTTNDDGTDSWLYIASWQLSGEAESGWTVWNHQPSSATYTASHPVLLTDDDGLDGDTAVVYIRDMQSPAQAAVAVVPYFNGLPRWDDGEQVAFPAPGLQTDTATLAGGTVTAVWHSSAETVSANVDDRTATAPAAPVPLTSSTAVNDVTALVSAADGTQALVFQGTDGLAHLVSRTSDTAAWGDAEVVPGISGYPPTVGAAISRTGTLVVSASADLDDDPDTLTHLELISTDVTGQGGLFHPVATTRVLDTRSGVGARRGQLAPGGSLDLRPVVAVGVGAVQLNVTAVGATGPGYLQLFPSTSAAPTTSSVNFAAKTPVANLVTVQTASDGSIRIRNGNTGVSVDVVADLTGWFAAGTSGRPGETVAVPPVRLVDTRSGTGVAKARVAGGADLQFPVAGSAGVPGTGAAAVLLNLTATGATGSGFLASHASGTATPGTSDLNFTAGQVVAAGVLVPLGADGAVAVHNGSGGPVDVVVDIQGYVTAGAAALPGALALMTPTRLVDTRNGSGGCGTGPSDGCRIVCVTGAVGVPSSGVAAAVFTATATDTSRPGFLSITASVPNATSTLNFTAGETVANGAWSALGTDPSFPGCIGATFGPAGTQGDVILDLRGYVLS